MVFAFTSRVTLVLTAFITLQYFCSQAFSETNPYVTSILSIKTSNDKKYYATVVEALEKPSHGDPVKSKIFSRQIFDKAESWLLRLYEERYATLLSKKQKDALSSIHTTWDERSSLIIIWKDDHFHTPAAIMRFTWPTIEKPLLPSEIEAGHKIKREIIPFDDSYPDTENFWHHEMDFNGFKVHGEESVLHGNFAFHFETPDLTGATQGHFWEIKNFVIEQGLEHDLAPLLLFVSERTRISYINSIFPYKLPSEYIISCHPIMRNYYQHLGFEIIPDIKLPDDSILLKISRNGFIDKVGSAFNARPGFQWLKNIAWDVTNSNRLFNKFLNEKCNRLLRSRRGFDNR